MITVTRPSYGTQSEEGGGSKHGGLRPAFPPDLYTYADPPASRIPVFQECRKVLQTKEKKRPVMFTSALQGDPGETHRALSQPRNEKLTQR